MKKKYTVVVEYIYSDTLEIEAADKEQAEEIALKEATEIAGISWVYIKGGSCTSL